MDSQAAGNPRRPGALAVHSLHRFVFSVPDLGEAAYAPATIHEIATDPGDGPFQRGARLASGQHLRARIVVLQREQRRRVEVGIAHDAAGRVDERNATMESFAGCISEGIGVGSWTPFTSHELSFLPKIPNRFGDQPVAQPAIGENDNENRHQRNDGERSRQDSFGEPQPRSGGRSRYPNPRTVSMSEPAGPSLVRSR